MLRAAEAGLTISLHAETGEIIEHYRRQFAADGKKDPQYHAWSRPWFCELEAVERALALNAAVGGRLYFVHVTTRAALEAIIRARREGQAVWAETCPHYLFLNESALRAPDGGRYVMAPPLRRADDSAALWSGLADGTVQVVATDHCPFPLKTKVGRPFYEVPSGVGSIELLFNLILSEGVLAPGGPRLTPSRVAAVLSTNPARFFGLYPRKGHIAPGADADLIVVDPLRTRTVRAADLHGGEDHSIYEGETLRGAVGMTISRGEVVYDRGKILGEAGRGRYIHRPVAGWDRAGGART
jgi:dihydropyrimidinase